MISVLLMLAVVLPRNVYATLGEPESSVHSDRNQIKGAMVSTIARSGVRVYELLVDGVQVKEYVSSGLVFAVSWRGLVHPDLSTLLGSHFDEYQDQALLDAQTPQNHAPKVFRTARMVLEKSGHMRDVRGKAYLPDALPEDFDLHTLD